MYVYSLYLQIILYMLPEICIIRYFAKCIAIIKYAKNHLAINIIRALLMYNANCGVDNMKKTNKIGHRLLPLTLLIVYHKCACTI
jgi:hypothetical protein